MYSINHTSTEHMHVTNKHVIHFKPTEQYRKTPVYLQIGSYLQLKIFSLITAAKSDCVHKKKTPPRAHNSSAAQQAERGEAGQPGLAAE